MARVVIFTRLTARPGARDALLVELEQLGEAVRAEPGNEAFEVYAARDLPDVVVGYEVFRDDAALAEHRASDATKGMTNRLSDLLAGPPEITYAV
ncbi:MAG TPA: putative quinol monooxygenase [Acidimicrobiia bacterium]|nr:putative quinol monooxygenase [Acidimicrobiia bacterium]